MTGGLWLLGAALAGLVTLLGTLAAALWIALPALAAAVSARRCHGIPLYGVTALLAAATLPLAVLGVAPTRPESDSVAAQVDQVMAGAVSWPVVGGTVGAAITAGLSWGASPWAKSLSGVSWGLLAMAVVRQILGA